MKRIYYGMLATLFSTLVVAAGIIIKPMCFGYFYQPEVPKSFRK
ncbi:MAG: cyclic lactone autoinducer peptide [Bacillota bacterium]